MSETETELPNGIFPAGETLDALERNGVASWDSLTNEGSEAVGALLDNLSQLQNSLDPTQAAPFPPDRKAARALRLSVQQAEIARWAQDIVGEVERLREYKRNARRTAKSLQAALEREKAELSRLRGKIISDKLRAQLYLEREELAKKYTWTPGNSPPGPGRYLVTLIDGRTWVFDYVGPNLYGWHEVIAWMPAPVAYPAEGKR